MNKQDGGTFHLKVEFENARGFIYRINTGWRFERGTADVHPIDAKPIPPVWENEEELISATVFTWTEGNYSCDCNRHAFIADAYQEERDENGPCGHELNLKRLTLLRPDMTEQVIWEGCK